MDDSAGADDLAVRRYEPTDEDDVIALLAASLGWDHDERHRALFRWKHNENPFGSSPAWVAREDGRLAAVRVLMRWDWVATNGTVRRAVRAVDTATHPSFQGRGLFRRLTMRAVDELTADGVDFVFNTPNDQSLPGYLKMGWSTLGRAPIAMRPRSPASIGTVIRARTPAALWSEPTAAFDDARVALDAGGAERLARLVDRPAAMTTHRTAAYLRWRYGLPDLHYRIASPGDDPDRGAIVFRVRSRGPAREVAICDVLAPEGVPGLGRLLGRILAAADADYAVAALPPRSAARLGMMPLPRQGPLVTRRPLADPDVGVLSDFAFSLGDMELF